MAFFIIIFVLGDLYKTSKAINLSDFIIHFVFHDLPFMGNDFDRAVWSSALGCKNGLDCLDKESACLRGEMYQDLEKNYLLQGIQRSKVVELLGGGQDLFPVNGDPGLQGAFCGVDALQERLCQINRR